MPMTSQLNVTLENITKIINSTTGDPIEFAIRVNNTAYGGWFYFIMLILFGLVLFKLAQKFQDQPMVNAMYVCTALTLMSFILRGVFIIENGVVLGLLTDWQMWIFPLVTAILAAIVKYTSDS